MLFKSSAQILSPGWWTRMYSQSGNLEAVQYACGAAPPQMTMRLILTAPSLGSPGWEGAGSGSTSMLTELRGLEELDESSVAQKSECSSETRSTSIGLGFSFPSAEEG